MFATIRRPIQVFATQEIIEILERDIFNWSIWPDFNQIPNKNTPFMVYEEISLGQSITINRKTMTVLPANHVVPAVGYQVDSGSNSLVYTGDTAGGKDFWLAVNKIKNLKYMLNNKESLIIKAQNQIKILIQKILLGEKQKERFITNESYLILVKETKYFIWISLNQKPWK